MSKVNDSFEIKLDQERASWACRDALAQIGWGIKEMDERRIVPKIGVGISRNPSKIEVVLDGNGDSTQVTLNGSIVGVGPLQKRHLVAHMNKLRNQIEVSARKEAT